MQRSHSSGEQHRQDRSRYGIAGDMASGAEHDWVTGLPKDQLLQVSGQLRL